MAPSRAEKQYVCALGLREFSVGHLHVDMQKQAARDQIIINMRIDIITIFPKMFNWLLGESILKRAQEKGRVSIFVHDLRDYSRDKHRKVDDRPFGGGSGMIISAQPVFDAVDKIKRSVKSPNSRVILMCPQGKTYNQPLAKKLSKCKHLIFICGHYEGVDERIREHLVDEEISIGDYVLTGGELPTMVVIDSLVRLLPGVLGDKNSLNFESFEGNLLEYPQYTRPAKYKCFSVPGILLSGDHQKIQIWRKQQSLRRTKKRRPDLFIKFRKEK